MCCPRGLDPHSVKGEISKAQSVFQASFKIPKGQESKQRKKKSEKKDGHKSIPSQAMKAQRAREGSPFTTLARKLRQFPT